MKKLFFIAVLSVVALISPLTNSYAATVSLDFDSLPGGELSDTGVWLGDVLVSSPDGAGVGFDDSPGMPGTMIMIGISTVVFEFASSINVSKISALVGSNNSPITVSAFGSEGNGLFSMNDPWSPGVWGDISGIGNIQRVEIFGYESWVGGFSYEYEAAAVPIPGAALLFASGIAGLFGIRKKA